MPQRDGNQSQREDDRAKNMRVQRDRKGALAKVFRNFDLDSSGSIEPDELKILGQMRKYLGQKKRHWDEAKNKKLLKSVDKDKNGNIEMDEFVAHFIKALDHLDQHEFMQTMSDFTACAVEAAKRDQASPPSPEADLAFKALDKNGDGVISKEEFYKAFGSMIQLSPTAHQKVEAYGRPAAPAVTTQEEKAQVAKRRPVPPKPNTADKREERAEKHRNKRKEKFHKLEPVLEKHHEKARRLEMSRVFRKFGVDSTDSLEVDGLEVLGETQVLGQHPRHWDATKNKKATDTLEPDVDGYVQVEEVVERYYPALRTLGMEAFMETMADFASCAEDVRGRSEAPDIPPVPVQIQRATPGPLQSRAKTPPRPISPASDRPSLRPDSESPPRGRTGGRPMSPEYRHPFIANPLIFRQSSHLSPKLSFIANPLIYRQLVFWIL